MLCLLEIPVLRFALLPYYQRISNEMKRNNLKSRSLYENLKTMYFVGVRKKKVIFCLTCLRYFERFSSSLTEAYVGFLLEVFCNNG